MTHSNNLVMLPPAPHLCQICAVEHLPEEPHNAQSFFYKFWFSSTYKRPVTWADAMLHCPDHIKKQWTENFKKCGIDVNSPNLTGAMTSMEEVEDQLKEN